MLSQANAIQREEKFDEWLAENFDTGETRKGPTWKELAYFVAGEAGDLDGAGNPREA